ncbi:MAG: hypothetical protein PUC65_04355 [Clostridiales bacterium]|nr:hypothetical protein [Clostridiales bacterium]
MKRKLLTFLLLFSLVIASVAPSTAQAATKKEKKTNETVQKKEHGTTPFSKITYKRPDINAIEKKLDKIAALSKKDNQYKKINSLMDEVDDDLTDVITMIRYLNIKLSKDVTDTQTANEFNDLNTQYMNLIKKCTEVYVELLESQYGDELKKDLTEKEIENIYKNKETLSEDYIKLQSEALSLSSEYQLVFSTTTIDVKGNPMSISEVVSDPSLSQQEILYYYSQLMNLLNEKEGEIYLKLVKNYKAQAKLAGFDNVAAYMYEQLGRDFTKEQSRLFGQYVKEEVIPLYQTIAASLTPEDLIKVQSAPGSLEQFEPTFRKYFSSINDEMLKCYDYMKKYELCDNQVTPVKMNQNYTTLLNSYNEPYMSLYPMGTYNDISTFIHEFGHFYAFYTHGDDLELNLDIMEIHSQADELLFMPNFEVYGDAYEPIVKYQLITMLYSAVINGSLYDEFQQRVFEKDITSVKELNELFFKLECEYGLADPASDVTEDGSWVLVPHTFTQPFYYISYAIAAVPALEVYAKSLTDRDAAIASYNKLIKYGTDYDYTSLLMRSRIASPFSEYTLDTIADSIYEYLGLPNPDNAAEAPAA